ncbi:MAG: molybdopterin-dependent oxidoreductase [Deltaproteobacteria bacterium]|jgi:anaerobic selenocysteine-containing dehydrogenase|nr:molybdopterin-dependent oxidoreductase [Deltaproteobacteria bacterium]
MSKKIFKTTCTRDCPNTCGLIAEVEDGILKSLKGDKDNPSNMGRACHKAAKYVRRVYDSQRQLTPLLKKGGSFSPVSWEEALSLFENKIKQVAAIDPSKILYYQGFGARTALKLINRRFFNLLGNVTVTCGTICGGAGQGAQDLDFGSRISHDIRDHLNASSLFVWGRNPVATSLNLIPVMKELKAQGKEVVLIDPIRTQSAALASLYVSPKPGTDSYLALALARIVMEKGQADQDFLENHTLDLEKYKEIVFSQSLAERSKLCQVSEKQIVALGDILTKAKPTAFVLGWGLHRWERSDVTIRAIDALGAVCGSIGVKGGGVSQGFEEYQPYDWSVWGDSLRPNRRKIYMQLLGLQLQEANPPIDLIFITAGNPCAMLPDSNRVVSALRKVPFKVVAGHFLDDTAQEADLFLPVTTFLEEKDVVASYGHSWIGPLNQAIEPVGQCRSDFDIFMDLGTRFDFAADYVKSRDQWLEIILKPTLDMGVSLEEIFQGGVYQKDIPFVPYLDKSFPTKTGKFNLLNYFAPPALHQEQFDFHLMSVAPSQWLCSEILDEEHPSHLEVSLSPKAAASQGFNCGDWIELYNDLGSLKARVKIEEGLRDDLVVAPRGGWTQKGCNVNVLTEAVVTQVGSGTAYYESRVNLRKITP